MKAEARAFTFIANEAIVKIPFFQRQYVWNDDNWTDLLNELLDSQRSHFLGSIILKQHETQSGSVKEVSVIDGQQRLTTLSILLKVIYDLLPEAPRKQSEASINSLLYYKQNMLSDEKMIKISHSIYDAPKYKTVINSNSTEIMDSTDESGIIRCYQFFYNELKEKDPEQKTALFNLLANNFSDDSNKILVVIDLGKDEDEQSIFDTINSAGVRLSSADTIKNALFQEALKKHQGNEQTVYDSYKKFWEAIFLIKGDASCKEFWEKPQLTGRTYRDNLEILLHSIAVIKGFFDPSEHRLSDLSKLYKNYIGSLTEAQILKFIEEIASYALLYREKLCTIEQSDNLEFSESTMRLLHILSRCEITTFHPFLLFIFEKHKNNIISLEATCHKLEKYIIRQAIAGKTTKDYNKVCKELIKNPDCVENYSSMTTDEEVKVGLCKINNKLAALVLFWIELYIRHNDSKFDNNQKSLKYVYSLEHILPQKWREYWREVPIRDFTGNIIGNSELAEKERDKKCYEIGNMTLLGGNLNTALRNYPYGIKINGEGRKKGMQHYNDLSITKSIIEKYNNGDTAWDEKHISDRTSSLTSIFLKIW